ncbi:hypothetical protein H072_895 [Dactylellina haptotyla CBS 200.50]|uniref:Uncharacterized protein n=1 Tax=Dactylellina haptotyla (strain CBS 200.50) TaxID=1284197 RepID=S8AQG3_DACHA|nr:hypothetical protein H072_895 [Dactylellina haptotyla CBS 200.50]
MPPRRAERPAGAPDIKRAERLVPRLQTLLDAIKAHQKYRDTLPNQDSPADPLAKALFFLHDFAARTHAIMSGVMLATNRATAFMQYYTARVAQMGMGDRLPSRPPNGYTSADAEVDEVIMTETEFDPRLVMDNAQRSGMKLLFDQEIGDWLEAEELNTMAKIYAAGSERCTMVALLCQDGTMLAEMVETKDQFDLGEGIKSAGAALLQ